MTFSRDTSAVADREAQASAPSTNPQDPLLHAPDIPHQDLVSQLLAQFQYILFYKCDIFFQRSKLVRQIKGFKSYVGFRIIYDILHNYIQDFRNSFI